MSRFHRLRWSPQGQSFAAEGPVRVVYRDTGNGKTATLTARNVQYNAQTGVVSASGGILLEREEGQFAGQSIEYNFRTDAGRVTGALLLSPFFRMQGDRIERREDGTYVVENGYFTTCENQRPDYRIRAGRLTVSPDRFVAARNITFYTGGTPLISLPSFRRNLRTTTPPPIPRAAFTKVEGIVVRQVGSPISRPDETFDFDLRVNLRRLPAGFLIYQKDLTRGATVPLPPFGLLYTLEDPLRGFLEQLSPPAYPEYGATRYQEAREPRATFFASVQNSQFIYNRRRSDLLVSRFPEVGVRWTNLLGRRAPAAETPVSSTDASFVRRPTSEGPFTLDLSAALGALSEAPTGASAGRLALRTSLASHPLLLSKQLSLRLGATHWMNLYTSGRIYHLFSPEVDLHYLPARTTFLSAGYRYATEAGATPFVFDRQDVRHELRLRAQFGGPWAFGVTTRYDLERARAYDTEFAVLRNLDCLQVGFGYRARAQQFGIIFNLLPPTPDRAERRIAPLTPPVTPP
ncbi:MAG: hypothetical protein RMJ43_15885 [Chloroherpetonaceae bacterium]|nr:hypothetical protein [Chthonomonadaceae bacterium]MDW8209315.1 hypothetical protein [Chloroherpetonaceae bacterium]